VYSKNRKERLLERFDVLARNGAWPSTAILNPRRWLTNFLPAEYEHALDILEALIVVPNNQLVALLKDSFLGLSIPICNRAIRYPDATADWTGFVGTLTVTPVTKENPHPTQSGYSYARLVRQHLDIPKKQIVELADAVKQIATVPSSKLLLVDDLVGSGEQCIKLCERKINLCGIGSVSLSDLFATGDPQRVFYRPLFATRYGLDRIIKKHPWLQISPVYLLASNASAQPPNSSVWQEGRAATAAEFVREASGRAGIPYFDRWGFHSLGLCIAFEYGPPDASLPIIMEDNSNWKPLIKRA
jgi:hypothetical protein